MARCGPECDVEATDRLPHLHANPQDAPQAALSRELGPEKVLGCEKMVGGTNCAKRDKRHNAVIRKRIEAVRLHFVVHSAHKDAGGKKTSMRMPSEAQAERLVMEGAQSERPPGAAAAHWIEGPIISCSGRKAFPQPDGVSSEEMLGRRQ